MCPGAKNPGRVPGEGWVRPSQLPDCPVYFLTANSHHLVLERPASYFPCPPFIPWVLRKCKSWRHSEGMHKDKKSTEHDRRLGSRQFTHPPRTPLLSSTYKFSGLPRIGTCELRASLFYYAYQLHLSLAYKYH